MGKEETRAQRIIRLVNEAIVSYSDPNSDEANLFRKIFKRDPEPSKTGSHYEHIGRNWIIRIGNHIPTHLEEYDKNKNIYSILIGPYFEEDEKKRLTEYWENTYNKKIIWYIIEDATAINNDETINNIISDIKSYIPNILKHISKNQKFLEKKDLEFNEYDVNLDFILNQLRKDFGNWTLTDAFFIYPNGELIGSDYNHVGMVRHVLPENFKTIAGISYGVRDRLINEKNIIQVRVDCDESQNGIKLSARPTKKQMGLLYNLINRLIEDEHDDEIVVEINRKYKHFEYPYDWYAIQDFIIKNTNNK